MLHGMQATEFIQKWEITVTFDKVGRRLDCSQWPDNAKHFRFELTIGDRSFSGYYSQGSGIVKDPTSEDLVYALQCDVSCYESCPDLADFLTELGYTENRDMVRQGIDAYEACKRSANFFSVDSELYDDLLSVEED